MSVQVTTCVSVAFTLQKSDPSAGWRCLIPTPASTHRRARFPHPLVHIEGRDSHTLWSSLEDLTPTAIGLRCRGRFSHSDSPHWRASYPTRIGPRRRTRFPHLQDFPGGRHSNIYWSTLGTRVPLGGQFTIPASPQMGVRFLRPFSLHWNIQFTHPQVCIRWLDLNAYWSSLEDRIPTPTSPHRRKRFPHPQVHIRDSDFHSH